MRERVTSSFLCIRLPQKRRRGDVPFSSSARQCVSRSVVAYPRAETALFRAIAISRGCLMPMTIPALRRVFGEEIAHYIYFGLSTGLGAAKSIISVAGRDCAFGVKGIMA